MGKRETAFNLLEVHLLQQMAKHDEGIVELVSLPNNGEKSIGYYRNELIKKAKGKYIAFIDDDDWVSDKYIDLLLRGMSIGADCCSLIGEYWSDGKYDRNFYHSLKYDSWSDDEKGYYRNPNHLNCIKRDLVADIPFAEISHGEDSDWSAKVLQSGRLKTEAVINETLYIYRHKSYK